MSITDISKSQKTLVQSNFTTKRFSPYEKSVLYMYQHILPQHPSSVVTTIKQH